MWVVVKMAPGCDPAQHARDGGLSHACPPGDLSWGDRPAGVDQRVQAELVAGQPHRPQSVIEQTGGEVAHQPHVEKEGGVIAVTTVTFHINYDTVVFSQLENATVEKEKSREVVWDHRWNRGLSPAAPVRPWGRTRSRRHHRLTGRRGSGLCRRERVGWSQRHASATSLCRHPRRAHL